MTINTANKSKYYRMKQVGLIIVLGLLAVASIYANDNEYAYSSAMELYNSGSYEKAIKAFTVLAEEGHHAASQYMLGIMNMRGQGVPKDLMKSASWFQKAAVRGHAAAQFELGRSYATGVGMPKDQRVAFNYYVSAANQGYTEAQYMVGLIYISGSYMGYDIKQDRIKAYMWLSLAALNGSQEAYEMTRELGKTFNESEIKEAKEFLKAWKSSRESK